jgi:hypothetical protein
VIQSVTVAVISAVPFEDPVRVTVAEVVLPDTVAIVLSEELHDTVAPEGTPERVNDFEVQTVLEPSEDARLRVGAGLEMGI